MRTSSDDEEKKDRLDAETQNKASTKGVSSDTYILDYDQQTPYIFFKDDRDASLVPHTNATSVIR